MEVAVPTLIVGVFLGILPVLVGLTVGAWIARGKTTPEATGRLEAERAQQIVAGLLQWANAVKGDVSQYGVEMADLSRRLRQTEQTAEDCPDHSTARATANDGLFTQMERFNQQLQERLLEAETELADQAKQLDSYLSQARTDQLTGLPNRRAFDEELSRRYAEFARKGTPLSLVLIDIDRFKAVNDRFGHLAGDEVLKVVAHKVKDCLRDIDTISRFGGEEFAVILPDTALQDALLPTERGRAAVDAAVVSYDDNEIGVTVSCGLAELKPTEDIASVLRRADEALYESKSSGRNCTHVHNGVTCDRVHPDGLLPIGPPKQRTCAQPTGLVPPQFDEVCQDLRGTLLQHLDEA